MTRLTHELLADIDKETVDFQPNYDDRSRSRRSCRPSVPEPADQRLVRHRGGHGHQHPAAQPDRGDRGCLALIDDPDLGIDGLMQYRPGPDFPTAGIINGAAGIIEAYRTGRGRIYVRAKAEIEVTRRPGARPSSSPSCPTR
jgi:DNA gyrase subunit A